MNSPWIENSEKISFPKLSESKKTDVLIVGGGLAGLLCAYKLRRYGVDCILTEAEGICNGTTKNTTAKITFAHGLIYDKLISSYGKETAKLYLESQRGALYEYRRLAEEISCDFEEKSSYVYSIDDKKKIEREAEALYALGQSSEVVYSLDLPIKVAAAVKVSRQAQFNPLKFAYSIAQDLPIYENTKIWEIKPGRALTDSGEIRYKKLIIATHFPIINKHGFYFLKMYQHRSYVLALENAQRVEGMYIDESETGLSFRNYGDLLLLGGGAHRTGKKGGSYTELESFTKKYYPKARIVNRFAAQDCMTLDGIPYIGSYSKDTPNVFVVTGFNKWGMTSSMVAADILCDLVRERKNEYAAVFSPSRSILHPQLAINAFESILGLITPTRPRCPHLGCALKYNKEEHSWDCPCHGSRFTENGELIDNPATDDKKNMP